MIKNISGVCVEKKSNLFSQLVKILNTNLENVKKILLNCILTYLTLILLPIYVNIICEESAVVSFFLRFILSLELNSGAILKVVSTKNNTCLTCVAHYSDTRSNSQCTAKHHNCLKNQI